MALSCSWKKSNAKRSNHVRLFPGSFAADLQDIRAYLGFRDDPEGTKLRFLDFAIEIVKMDLQCPTDPEASHQKAERACDLIPVSRACRPYAVDRVVQLRRKTVIRLPFSSVKGFQKKPRCTYGVYFPEVELVILQYNSYCQPVPSAKDGYAFGVEVFRLADAFHHLTTSQEFGFWLVDGKPIAEVKEARFAFLYELARERHSLRAVEAAEEDVLAAQKAAEAEDSQEPEAAETVASVPSG